MKKIFSSLIFSLILSVFCISNAYSWGFYGHRIINRMAVYTLPPEMFGFYKAHIQYITENAVNPDRRRYAVEGEAPRHYLDMDIYGDSAWLKIPHRWKDAVAKYSEDTLMAYGIVPWAVEQFRWKLTNAMERGDAEAIIRIWQIWDTTLEIRTFHFIAPKIIMDNLLDSMEFMVFGNLVCQNSMLYNMIFLSEKQNISKIHKKELGRLSSVRILR